MPEQQWRSANFSFLAVYDAQLVRLGALAERYFKEDPATCLIKLRQYGETLAQLVAAKAGLFRDTQEPQADLLRRLKFDRVITPQVGDFFHYLRTLGNKATHEYDGTHAEALTFHRALSLLYHHCLRLSRICQAVYFQIWTDRCDAKAPGLSARFRPAPSLSSSRRLERSFSWSSATESAGDSNVCGRFKASAKAFAAALCFNRRCLRSFRTGEP
jgi:hypothetical protein